eukprot:TRINITY_DN22016_c0_g2_i1.p1 TRINITY_DN22016_c0_g2~~TRINITY_DN22016_c0_g2_i1.p1  ORF type:complete len:476 (-),score=65.32 TRINITY_DN22016_c0_g2_i1:103-1530(-)
MCESPLETLCLELIDSNWLGILFELLLYLFCFLGLSIICDDHLVPSLETLCSRWSISEDVAGATFMAFGSGAPEVIISGVVALRSLADKSSDADGGSLGVGVVIGSGWIAFLLIPGCCAILGQQPLEVNRRPLLRDVVFYICSLVILIASGYDERLEFKESLALVSLYFLYLLVVVSAPRVRQMYLRHHDMGGSSQSLATQEGDINSSTKTSAKKGPDAEAGLELTLDPSCTRSLRDMEMPPPVGRSPELLNYHASPEPQQELELQASSSGAREIRSAGDLLGLPRKFLELAFSSTCPECELGSPQEGKYWITLLASFAWVAWFSLVITVITDRWVEISGVDAGFFGVTVVALGGQIPDALQSIAVAKKGWGSMAVANAIGSQNLNVLIGLGGSWLMVTSLGGEVKLPATRTLLVSTALQLFNVVIFLTLTLGLTIVSGRTKVLLSPSVGRSLIGIYAVCVVILFGSIFHEVMGR